jgi:predicted transcriptional regulator of viral defense system
MEAQGQQWYVGCISAMAELQLTDETPDVMVVITRGPKQLRLSKIAGRAIRIVNLRREDNWEGVDRIRLRGRTFTYRSGVERTLLDTLEYPRLCGPPELWVRAWERALREERVAMPMLTGLAETRSHAVQTRLAFWLAETGHPRDARYVLAMSKTRLTGRVFLDSSQAYAGQWPRDPATGLIINLPSKAIDGWLTYGE